MPDHSNSKFRLDRRGNDGHSQVRRKLSLAENQRQVGSLPMRVALTSKQPSARECMECEDIEAWR